MSLPRTQDTPALTALFRRSSIVAASLFALSGCVSSAAPDMVGAIEPLPAAQSAETADVAQAQPGAAGDQVAMAAGGQTDGAADPEGSADAGQVPPGDASQHASLTMQSTAVNANNGSIFAVQSADGNAAGATVTDPDGDTYTTPAYVPVPGINPAFRSLYQGGNGAPAEAEANAQTGQAMAAPETADGQAIQQPAGAQVAAVSTAETGPVLENDGAVAQVTTDPAVVVIPADQQNAAMTPAVSEIQPKEEAKKKKRTLADFFGSKKKKEPGFDQGRFSESSARKTLSETPQPVQTASLSSDALPGVTTANAMFATDSGPAMTGDANLPMEEDHIDTPVEIAALPGLARLASNGFWMQTEKVDTSCFKPELMKVLGRIEAHYGKKLMVTSGFRKPKSSRAKQSLHTICSAADIQIAGVSKWELAAFLRTMPDRGGVGTYCHTNSVHIDTGSARDWNWRCRRRK